MPRVLALLTCLLAAGNAALCQVAPPGSAPKPVKAVPPFTPGVRAPATSDWTSMHWAGGMPAKGGFGVRVIETGSYFFALDTRTLAARAFGYRGRTVTPYHPEPGDVDGPLPEHLRLRKGVAWESAPPGRLYLSATVDGERYEVKRGKPWDGKEGPRLIESGRYLQRGDVFGLELQSNEGKTLAGEFRLETVAWPDRLNIILHARPPLMSIPEGEACFGLNGGGFGLTGSNHLTVPDSPAFGAPQFTFELWAYVPTDASSATKQGPWIACRGSNEETAGGFGFTLHGARIAGRVNLIGGRAGARTLFSAVDARTEAWNHLAITCDGQNLALFVNGTPAASLPAGAARLPGQGALHLGRRGDGRGDGYHFKGAVDEVRFHPRALTASEVGGAAAGKSATAPGADTVALPFRADGESVATRARAAWKDVKMSLSLLDDHGSGDWRKTGETPADESGWHRSVLEVKPSNPDHINITEDVGLIAEDKDTGASLPVTRDAQLGCLKVDLDSVRGAGRGNDLLERVRLKLRKPGNSQGVARIIFTKTSEGLRHATGSPITGITAVLRTPDGTPTGIPVQLSKNWHSRAEAGELASTWFHAVTLLRLPFGRTESELELALAYGHWGRLPAVSHSQLSLVGWGSNQLWDEAAIGAWGENFCFEPDQAQRGCAVLDVRPIMVTSIRGEKWQWTNNVGGADWLRLNIAPQPGLFVPRADMRTTYLSQGPCLSRVLYTGRTGRSLHHSAEVSIGRTSDIARASYRIRADVTEKTDFRRFVIFQMGADMYNYPEGESLAHGDASGVLRRWQPAPSAERQIRQGDPVELKGRTPWASLHGGRDGAGRQAGAFADRGFIIREWKAVLGGRPALPWLVERGGFPFGRLSTTLDIVPPPDVKTLLPGDHVEALIEHVVLPQQAEDYYGPDEGLRQALRSLAAPERVLREAKDGAREAVATVGSVVTLHPAVTIACRDNRAEFTLAGGVGHVPVRLTGLTAQPERLTVLVGGAPARPATADTPAVPEILGTPLDPASHGREFWQMEPALDGQTYSVVINLPSPNKATRITVSEIPPPPAGLPAGKGESR
ncbi:MAG: LamG domain-containing protein [Opitutia bacterium]